MKRALTLGLMLIATAVNATDLALSTKHDELRALSPSRESLGNKTQWAPSGNFSALHGRAVFRGEIRSSSRPYARENFKTAAGAGIFLSRDTFGGTLNSAPSLHRYGYGHFNPLRYTDPSGHDVGQAENLERETEVIADAEKAKVRGVPTGRISMANAAAGLGGVERGAPLETGDQASYLGLLKRAWTRGQNVVPAELLAGPLFVERKAIESRTLGTVFALVSKPEQLSAILSGMSAADAPFWKTQDAIAPNQSRLDQLGAPAAETRFFGEMAKSRDAMLTGYWAIGLVGSLSISAVGAGEELAIISAERAAAANGKVTSDAVQRVTLEGNRPIVRPATQQPMGSGGVILRDGQGATAAEIAASAVGQTAGNRVGQAAVRQATLDAVPAGQPYTCWRCGETSTNPADMHLGHRNVPTSSGGNLSPANVCLEGAACNLSAGNRGGPSPGMSCVERGSCGAPYGR